MLDKSKREELINRLKIDNTILIPIPINIIDSIDPVDREDYILLSGYYMYLKDRRKKASDDEADNLYNEMFKVQEYMKEAEFGDKNIKRFTTEISPIEL